MFDYQRVNIEIKWLIYQMSLFVAIIYLRFMCFPRGNDVFLVDVVSDLMGFDVIECDFGGFVWIFVDFIG